MEVMKEVYTAFQEIVGLTKEILECVVLILSILTWFKPKKNKRKKKSPKRKK